MTANNNHPTVEDVRRALATVEDPELHRDLVSLNMIEDIRVAGGDVSFRVVLTTPACPLRAQIERDCRAAVSKLPGVGKISVEMSARVARGRAPAGKQQVAGVRHVVAVGSGKGGVGKSTVAVNLAIALAESGATVGILDADITGPNVPLMLGVDGEPVAVGEKVAPMYAHGIEVISIEFFVPKGQPVIWRAPMVVGAIQQFLTDVAWGDLDYLIVDLPPGTGDASISIAQLVPLSGVVIVSTPQEVALLDARKSLTMFEKLDAPILGIVENMSYFVCPNCSERHEIFGFGGAERAAKELGLPLLGRIPLDPEIREGGDRGMPVLKSAPESPQSAAFRELAANVAARISVLASEAASRDAGRIELPVL